MELERQLLSDYKSTIEKSYMIGLDLLRIFSAMMVLAFHSRGVLGLSYGRASAFVNQGAIFVSVFFMISGFALFLTNQKKDFTDIRKLKSFYAKRLQNILPAFALAWGIYYFLLNGDSGIPRINLLRIAPLEFLGLRCELLYLPGMNFFWFVSCIMIAYLCFPFIQMVVKQLSAKSALVWMVMIYAVLIYAKYLEDLFATPVLSYYVPFFRILEMCEGILSAYFCMVVRERCKIPGGVYIQYIVIFSAIVVFLGGYRYFLRYGNKWMWYDIFIVPCIGILLINVYVIQTKYVILEKIVRAISGVTYEVYLCQTWVFQLFSEGGIFAAFFELRSNREKVIIVWTMTFAISFIVNRLLSIIMNISKKGIHKYGK